MIVRISDDTYVQCDRLVYVPGGFWKLYVNDRIAAVVEGDAALRLRRLLDAQAMDPLPKVKAA